MVLQGKKVAIIGAGPVGLTLARLLQREGVEVAVYERDQHAGARVWGGTLDLHEGTGQEAMRKAGVLERYFAMGKPMGRTLVDEQGSVFLSIKPDYDSPEINRNALRTMLLASLAGDTVVWDRKCTGLAQRDGRWLLQFGNQPAATADIVIGANGGMSSVRNYVTDAEVEYTGTFIIQGEVIRPGTNCPEFYQLCAGNILMRAGNGSTFVANPDNDGALAYGVTFRKPEGWLHDNGLDVHHTDSISRFLTDMFSDWPECYQQVFRSTATFVGLPSRKISLDIPWKSDRPLPITLVGDAAHLMPPFAGQGVNIGLKDALILFDNLTDGKFETIEAAIRDYEEHMVVYAREAQRETSQNELAMHQPDFSFQKRFESRS